MTHLPDPVTMPDYYRDVPTKRLVAWIVDGLLIAILVAVAIPFTLFTALFYLPLLWIAISFAYRTITIANGSATLGMRLMGIELRDSRGEPLDFVTAALHTGGYLVSVSFVFPQIISIVMMLTGARKQGLTDTILATAAINRSPRLTPA